MVDSTEAPSAPVTDTDEATNTSQPARRVHRSGVNPGLRPKRVVETAEYAGFARRAVAALGRRVATGDVEAIVEMVKVSEALDNAMAEAIVGLRDAGYSWAEIGARLGISRQAVQQRWGKTCH